MDQELVFKAMADSSRRALMDALFNQDGQTLTELCAVLPDMTRPGCAKHLRLLEEAGLIVTEKVGREKHHYLNTVPIQLVYDRWVSKYAQPWAQSLTGLKYELEAQTMAEMHTQVFQVFIRTTPQRLWQAITDGDLTQQYYFNSIVKSGWEVGSELNYELPDGTPLITGEVLEIDPPNRLVSTFTPHWDPSGRAPTSRVTYEIEQIKEVCKLTVTHDDLDLAHPAHGGVIEGWSKLLSSMKSLIETGEPLPLE